MYYLPSLSFHVTNVLEKGVYRVKSGNGNICSTRNIFCIKNFFHGKVCGDHSRVKIRDSRS
jgi:hypothetical protein